MFLSVHLALVAVMAVGEMRAVDHLVTVREVFTVSLIVPSDQWRRRRRCCRSESPGKGGASLPVLDDIAGCVLSSQFKDSLTPFRCGPEGILLSGETVPGRLQISSDKLVQFPPLCRVFSDDDGVARVLCVGKGDRCDAGDSGLHTLGTWAMVSFCGAGSGEL